MSDLVRQTFDTLRATAKKRGGKLPDVGKKKTSISITRNIPATVPGLKLEAEQKKRSVRGIPTGADGRALPRSYKVSSFGALLGKEVRQRDWTEKMAHGWIMGHWPELVGAKIAQHTTVEMIKDGEVFITCDTTAWATQMKYMQREVLSAIAATVGPDVVTKLHIYGPKTKSWRYGPLHVKGRGPRDTYG
ncbi:hypothetical protein A0K93_10865 [Corynebacterium sp. BCW_4722]|nr:hypothetical protein A0K93_10865 [Corynebacterium sp. BCW_4722]